MFRRGQGEPRVAAHAAVPAQAVVLAGEQLILGAQLGRVRAEQQMAVQSTAEQLIAQLRDVPARLLRARWRQVPRHPRNLTAPSRWSWPGWGREPLAWQGWHGANPGFITFQGGWTFVFLRELWLAWPLIRLWPRGRPPGGLVRPPERS